MTLSYNSSSSSCLVRMNTMKRRRDIVNYYDLQKKEIHKLYYWKIHSQFYNLIKFGVLLLSSAASSFIATDAAPSHHSPLSATLLRLPGTGINLSFPGSSFKVQQTNFYLPTIRYANKLPLMCILCVDQVCLQAIMSSLLPNFKHHHHPLHSY